MGYPSHGMGSFQASTYIGDRQRGLPQKTSGEVVDAEMSGELASSKEQQHWDQYWDELEDLYSKAVVDDAFYLDESDVFGESFPRDILIPSPPRKQYLPSFVDHQAPAMPDAQDSQQDSQQVPQETTAQAQRLNTVVARTYAAMVKGTSTATQTAALAPVNLFDHGEVFDEEEDEGFSEQDVDEEEEEASDLDDQAEDYNQLDNPNHDYNGEDIEDEDGDLIDFWSHKFVYLRPAW